MSVSSTESGNTQSTRLSSNTSSDKKVVICRKHAEFLASGSSSVFPEKLGKVNKRSLHFRVSKGISDSIPIRTISNGTSQHNFNEPGGNCHSGPGNSGNVEERCNKISPTRRKKSVSKFNIYSPKKGLQAPPCDKPKEIEQAYSLYPFQNGGSFSFERNASQRGLHVQSRPKRCILFSATKSQIPKICEFQVERSNLSVSLPLLRPGTSTQDIYKTTEDSYFSDEEVECSIDNFSGRYSTDGCLGLGFLINIKKSVLQPCQTIQFLGMEINSIDMTVTLPQEKKDQIVKQCQDLLRKSSVSLRELTQLIGRLASTAIAVLPAPLQYRAMQCQQILELSVAGNYSSEIKLSDEVKTELQWWIQNLHLNNGRSVISYPPQLLITSDASLEGWGAFCQGHKTGGQWTLPEKKDHINILELKAAKYAILTFTRLYPTARTIHIKMDNIVALSYLVKMGGTRNQLLVQISKEIWEYLLDKGITITAEYLPGALNREADMQSRTVKDSSEWKLNPVVFQNLCKSWWTPDIDLFASRVSHQVPAYVSWKLDPYSKGRDAFQMRWTHTKGYAFPPFSLIGRVLHKVLFDQATLILITPAWQTQSWYPQLLRLSIRNPLILPKVPDLLQGPNKEPHPLITKGSLQLLAWIVSGKGYLQKEYQRKLHSYHKCQTIRHNHSLRIVLA